MHPAIDERQVLASLQHQGYRLTPQRLAILRILTANQNHPSALDIFELLQVDFPTMSLTTVYNTLSLFADLGLVQEIKLADGGIRYDINTEPHLNLYCRRCQTIIDLPFAQLADLQRTIQQTNGFVIDDSNVELAGTCSNCQQERLVQ